MAYAYCMTATNAVQAKIKSFVEGRWKSWGVAGAELREASTFGVRPGEQGSRPTFGGGAWYL